MPRKYPKVVAGYRSGLERANAELLESHGVEFRYEADSIPYEKPERKARYIPDFRLANGVIVETKGEFTAADRTKHLLLKQQYPTLDIRFVFSNSRSRLSKTSKTTYAEWCQKHGFMYADKQIPKEWMK